MELMMIQVIKEPGEKETLLMQRRGRDGRGNASVWNVFELLYSHFSTQLRIRHYY